MTIRIPVWGRILLLLMTLCPVSAHAQTIETMVMPGELIKDHAKYESECGKCHSLFDKKALTKLCLDCHKKIADDIRNHTRSARALHRHELPDLPYRAQGSQRKNFDTGPEYV